jgi:F-box/TPR repeat protein Pof3
LKLEKTQQALQIYARGLRYVPATNAQISLLRGAHDKLNRELCPPKAVDPLTQLPQEIVEMVMAYLKFYELVSCLRVSKQWKQFLESLPNLWTKMDLLRAGVKRAVKPSFVQTCMRMSRNKITYARIANFGHRGILQHLVKTCTSLEKLEFVLTQFGADSILEATIPCRQLKSLILHADIELQGDTIRQILKHRPTLEELRVHSVGPICSTNQGYNFDLPNLHILDLRAVHPRFIYANHLVSLLKSPHGNISTLLITSRPT